MDIFLLLIGNLLPLYALIGLGYIAGKVFHADRQTLGALGIYIFMPIVAFGFVAKMEFQASYIALPILYYLLLVVVTYAWLLTGRTVYGDKRANLLAMCASAGNTGYFGLPLVIALFPPELVGLYIFIMMGGSVYEATYFYYVAARGKFDVRQSLIKLAKFPTLYAIAAGIMCNLSGVEFAPIVDTYWGYFKGCYVVIGMMIIGAALARVKKLVWAPRFIMLSFLGKFLILPVIALILVYLDMHIFHWYDAAIHKMLFVMMIVPIAANIAAFAVEMDLKPEKAASTILYSTLFALLSIPLSLYLYEQFIAIAP